ncbi:phosphoribosyltransferase family protein (plasmid) [Streptomyces sp. NBC_00984]|uniref:orotate phosphoribosyltransferase n=1 Tax=Streptomyces sp. NBC_00984 TaxID=2903700 RepID=UPI00386A6066|nr:phosphoribosyltransferase family protein [Streptomyces sp. NBC_00984]
MAGPALAAVPLVTAVSLHTGLPAAYIRAAPKKHGTWQQIEGAALDSRRIVLIDDTARSGASLLRGARLLRIAGAQVTTAVCVLDRDAGVASLLANHRMTLSALLTDPETAP